MSKSNTCVMLVCSAMVLASAACAWGMTDLAVPPWRGEAGSTYQEWQFNADADPAAPDVIINPYGGACADITVGMFGSGWWDQLPGLGNATGYWDIGGEGGQIVIDIDNRPLELPYKEIWVQVISFVDITQAPIVDVPGAILLESEEFVVEQVSTGGDWILSLTKWRLEPNPPHERIILTANPAWGTVIDFVAVDTICVPEPASLLLLSLGVPLAALRRRRH